MLSYIFIGLTVLYRYDSDSRLLKDLHRASSLSEDFRRKPLLKFLRKLLHPWPWRYIVKVLSTRKTHRQLLSGARIPVMEEETAALESAKRQFIRFLESRNARSSWILWSTVVKKGRVRRENNFLRKRSSAAIDIFESCSSMVSIFRKRRNVIFEKYVT